MDWASNTLSIKKHTSQVSESVHLHSYRSETKTTRKTQNKVEQLWKSDNNFALSGT